MLLDQAVLPGIVFRICPIVKTALVAALGRTPLPWRAPLVSKSNDHWLLLSLAD